jgi:hypothetical protein
MKSGTVHRVSGHVMLGLSLFAMLLVVGAAFLTRMGEFDPSPGGDEGTPAHLFHFALVLLLPTVLAFLTTADWTRPRNVAKSLVLPALALVVAISTLFYMEHLR